MWEFKYLFLIIIRVECMYRPSNERYSESSQLNAMGSYPPMSAMQSMPNMQNIPPIPNMPKMHMLDGNYPPMPLYYDPQQPPPYEYPPPQNPNSEPYDRFNNWRDASESKPPMIMTPPMGVPHYEMRPMHHEPYPPQQKPPIQSQTFQPGAQGPVPQVNVVQRISGIIKSQLSHLQSIMIYADRRTHQEKMKKERDRSRSRSRDRPSRNQPLKFHREWNCLKCAFLNFDFRDRCKRCNEAKPDSVPAPPRVEGGGRGYVPGPDDWRCNKCGNINYARRLQCHRCRTPRNK